MVSLVIEPETGGRARNAALFFAGQSAALSFAGELPDRLSEQAADKVEFEAQLEDNASRPRVVPALVLLNVLVYALLGLGGAGWTTTDPQALIAWGSNFAPYTSDGQWWRLLTAAFLHGGLTHLLVNMVTLYDIGRLCERLFGSRRFAALYLVSGLLGSAASVWWNPHVNSVGASGAIFGVLGATFVYMLDKRNGVPVTVMKAHAVSMGAFIAYILINGLARAGIDNAAHIGGLIGGLVMGYAFARPLARRDANGAAGLRPALGLTFSVIMIAVLVANTPNTRGAYELDRRFLGDLAWFQAEKKVLMTEMNQLGMQAKQHGMTEAELRPVVAKLTEGWKRVHIRLSGYRLDPASRLREAHDQLTSYVSLRHRAVVLAAEALEAPDQAEAKFSEVARLMREGDAVVKRMQDKNKAGK
jgi:rhomboid protease GluP